jgi:hypothetical protein
LVFFLDNRRPFFGLTLLVILTDVPEALVKGRLGLRAVPAQYAELVSVLIIIAVIGLLSANRRVHRVLPLAFLAALGGYELFSAVRHIAGGT